VTFWAGTSYLLTSAVFQPFIGALSDVFGRRELLLLSLLLFTLGTTVCCAAENFTSLLSGRAIQGIGGGGIIVMVLVIFTDIVPLRQRPKYNGYVQMAWAFGTITGPLVGGAFAQHVTWRWIFYINFPFCGIGLLMIPIVVNLEKPKASSSYMFSRVDWVGGFLFIGSTTTFLMAVTWGGLQYPWGSYQTLVPLLVGIAGCFATVAWEIWGAKFPFVRLSIFMTRSAAAAYTCATTQGLLVSIIYHDHQIMPVHDRHSHHTYSIRPFKLIKTNISYMRNFTTSRSTSRLYNLCHQHSTASPSSLLPAGFFQLRSLSVS